MKKHSTERIALGLFYLVVCSLALSACALPGTQQQLKQAVVQTAVADSLVGTHAAGTLTAIIPTVTSTPLPPTTAPATATPTRTQLPNVTPTLAGVWLTLPSETDCRTGPHWAYPTLVVIKAEQLVEIMALDPLDEYYYIRDPGNFSQFCWIAKPSARVNGNLSQLPIITSSAPTAAFATTTGTPAALDFYARFEGVVNCKENYGIVLYVKNTGSLILRSIRVVLTDTTINKSYLHDANLFRGTTSDECVLDLDNAESDLQNGEGSLVACVNGGQFNHNPAGHVFTARITLYNQDDRKGEYVTRTITFIP
jgi:hypothetical protein